MFCATPVQEKSLEQSLLGSISISPSKKEEKDDCLLDQRRGKRRQKGLGSGSIHWRIITRNGKDYQQAYYHWKEDGRKTTKYIPKKLLGVIQLAEEAKPPVREILRLLGVEVSPRELLGDKQVSPSKNEEIGDMEVSPTKLLGDKQVSPSKNEEIGDMEVSPTKLLGDKQISPSKNRRHKGYGSGSIHCRIVTKKGKDYSQAYYHYEIWNFGDCQVKSSKYIPKRLLAHVQELEVQKAPVREVLRVLGVVV